MISYVVIGVVVLVIIIGAIWYEQSYLPKHPKAPAVATDVTAALDSLSARIDKLEGKTTPSKPMPAGKDRVPGVLTIAVTGDPKVDIPAINAQYFS